MTLPTTTSINGCDDDSDMFGPPRSSPPIGYHHHRSRVPMISPKLRQREERKRILQLCAHKLERIKDSETNLRRSVCINNTYCRLNDELRREKQSRYLANLPRTETKPESARENIFNPYNACGNDSNNRQTAMNKTHNDLTANTNNNQYSNVHSQNQSTIPAAAAAATCNATNTSSTTTASPTTNTATTTTILTTANTTQRNTYNDMHATTNINNNNNNLTTTTAATTTDNLNTKLSNNTSSSSNNNAQQHQHHHHHHQQPNYSPSSRKRQLSSNNLHNDLEILDRELNAIDAPMPLIDPEITQGAEQLEKAISSRKRLRSEDESDRLVREALSQFYIPPQRLISAIEDCPLDVVSLGVGVGGGNCAQMNLNLNGNMMTTHTKRQKLSGDLELDFDMNQNQKDFEVIMDALRLGSPSPTPSMGSVDSCGQAAMMSESASVFHNLVVTSLET